MYYCEECRKIKGWPESLAQSRGPCEVCGKTRTCHDRKSSDLPLPPPSQGKKVCSQKDCGRPAVAVAQQVISTDPETNEPTELGGEFLICSLCEAKFDAVGIGVFDYLSNPL